MDSAKGAGPDDVPKTAKNVGLEAIPKLDRVLWGVALVVIGYAYWPTILEMHERWANDPRYSHGYLVPAFSAFLLWHRRDLVNVDRFGPRLWGIGPILVGVALKIAGGLLFFGWFDALSLLFMLTGLVVLAGGWPMLRWAWPSIAFLFFMIPLPYRFELMLGSQLQTIATTASTYALELFGLPAVAEGFVITMDDVRIGVVEACNGVGMLVMFFAYAAAAVLLIKRPWPDKVAIMVSAVPIAMFANICRITLTGLLHAWVGKSVADWVYHDFAGWLMMPMALAVFYLELKLLDWLFIELEPVSVEPKLSMAGGMSLKAKGLDKNRPGGGRG